MPDKQCRISDLMLERYYLEELPETQMRNIEACLKQNAECRDRLKRLENSNREILEEYSTEEEAATIRRKLHLAEVTDRVQKVKREKAWFRRSPMLVPAVLLAVLIFTFLPMFINLSNDNKTVAYVGTKGLEPHLEVYLKQQDTSILLHKGDTVRRGDLLQLGYLRGGKSHGLIFSLDGAGSLTLHFPPVETVSTALGREGKYLLDFSYELDDAPRFERFYFIASDKPFDHQSLLRQVERNRDRLMDMDKKMELPAGLSQEVFTLYKAED